MWRSPSESSCWGRENTPDLESPGHCAKLGQHSPGVSWSPASRLLGEELILGEAPNTVLGRVQQPGPKVLAKPGLRRQDRKAG